VPESNLPALDRINLLMSGGIVNKKVQMITGDTLEVSARFIDWISPYANFDAL